MASKFDIINDYYNAPDTGKFQGQKLSYLQD